MFGPSRHSASLCPAFEPRHRFPHLAGHVASQLTFSSRYADSEPPVSCVATPAKGSFLLSGQTRWVLVSSAFGGT